jgi:Tfp pilus assembly protein PilE
MEQQKGITLIALVITIIVLLILAAISIATLTGENGILIKASTAKEKATIAEETEIIKIAYTDILTENITEEKEIASNVLKEKINQTKTAEVKEVNEIPEGAIVVENGASKGTICKITMEYVYYMYLNDNPMKKFYIELYDDREVNGGKLTETLVFNFEDGMDFDEWRESKYCIGLENWSSAEAYPGGWIQRGYTFYYNNNRISL